MQRDLAKGILNGHAQHRNAHKRHGDAAYPVRMQDDGQPYDQQQNDQREGQVAAQVKQAGQLVPNRAIGFEQRYSQFA